MRAKRAFWSVVAAVVLVTASGAAGVSQPSVAGAAVPPNVVVIMTDDQWYDSMATSCRDSPVAPDPYPDPDGVPCVITRG